MKRTLNSVYTAVLRSSISATAIAALLLACAPARANPTLLITELSDTDLMVTLDGLAFGTVTNVAPAQWEWRSNIWGSGISFDADSPGWNDVTIGNFWAEPSDATKANFVGVKGFFDPYHIPSFHLGFVIYSGVADFVDAGTFSTTPNLAVPNGTLGMRDLTFLNISTNAVLGGPWDVYYLDLADTAQSVPEGSSTLVLLGLSCAALIVARRRRSA